MRYIVKNLTRRPVSILCNSGKSYHLPPKYEHEVAGIEIENNSFIGKLRSRNVLDVKPLGEDRKTESEDSDSRKPAAEKKQEPDAKSKSVKK